MEGIRNMEKSYFELKEYAQELKEKGFNWNDVYSRIFDETKDYEFSERLTDIVFKD